MGKTAFEIAKKSAEIQWIQKLAENPPKIGWHLKQKAIRSVLGNVGFSINGLRTGLRKIYIKKKNDTLQGKQYIKKKNNT